MTLFYKSVIFLQLFQTSFTIVFIQTEYRQERIVFYERTIIHNSLK